MVWGEVSGSLLGLGNSIVYKNFQCMTHDYVDIG